MKKNPREYVNNILLEPLAKGESPIRMKPRQSLQYSGTSSKMYRGCNQALLQALKYKNEFNTNTRHTFNNVKKLGGSVKKGEKSSYVVFGDTVVKKKEVNGEEETSSYYFLKQYPVFNHCQTTLSDSLLDEPVLEKMEIQKIIEEIEHKKQSSPKAWYNPMTDTVGMPMESDFTSRDKYYHTYAHELSHRTGASNRLNRPGITRSKIAFGDQLYGAEELIAESGACYLGQQTDIDMNVLAPSRQYFQGRYRSLKGSKTNIISCLNKGREASSYLLASGTPLQF